MVFFLVCLASIWETWGSEINCSQLVNERHRIQTPATYLPRLCSFYLTQPLCDMEGWNIPSTLSDHTTCSVNVSFPFSLHPPPSSNECNLKMRKRVVSWQKYMPDPWGGHATWTPMWSAFSPLSSRIGLWAGSKGPGWHLIANWFSIKGCLGVLSHQFAPFIASSSFF